MPQKKARQGRQKRERAAFVKKRAAADANLLDSLAGLRRLRAPYDDVLAAIVTEMIGKYPPLPDKPLVEIGAGTGQLRAWLPAAIRNAVVHTDPSDRALDVLRRHVPHAQIAVAGAHKLPFSDGACGGAFGLCVFDTIHTAAGNDAAVAELARVLAPGGRFVHFLDMAPLLDRPFEEFNAQGMVPIPNVLGDPDDHDWPLDIVLFDREWLREILHFALRVEHPLVTLFGPYFGAFFLEPFDRKEAVGRFKSLATNSEMQQGLARQLASAIQLAVRQGHAARAAVPFHSGQYLSEVMESTFARTGLFRTDFFGIVARSVWRPAPADDAQTRPFNYRSLCLGHERVSDRLPKRLLSTSSRPDLASGDAPADPALVEAGVFVFVAQRV